MQPEASAKCAYVTYALSVVDMKSVYRVYRAIVFTLVVHHIGDRDFFVLRTLCLNAKDDKNIQLYGSVD